MRSVLFAILVGLFGAALLHIVIVLALPQFTGRDAYTRVLDLLEMDSFFPLTAEPSPTGLRSGNPFLRTAVCSFSVADAPTRFIARGPVPFWSLSVFDSGSNEVFSMNDHTAVNGNLDLIVATPIQLVELRKSPPEELTQSIMIEMKDEEGYAVLRALAPFDSFEEQVRDFLSDSSCQLFRRS
ncbi:DUF1254 domain-containing protein [Sinorhizobium alkalisoli]|uniref:DUF1254 domain-containing protein n=1 Tax=Sinorhizobium alkalisoli TaxID=1752398 RepID=A0A1E3V8E5_9HYPH|nr:DUF1254 domain-containing protein [Sinorhizobium alkalisoli]MCG5478803.1 DUF1254 domain-containing protein [Sinorhizobium alkalisoli]ODR89096.1 DUF1254 domain-containing protein [Sinorhizobium alkalisoli]QFI65514.1 hypothetical protein EKH55_0640 [Sinorhizobium alkalisoli]